MKKFQFFFGIWFLLSYSFNMTFSQTTLRADPYRQGKSEIVSEKEFTFKAVETCGYRINYSEDTISYFIGIKTPVVPQDTTKAFTIIYEGCTYYWHIIFNEYSNKNKIKILEELLEYEKDTDLSGRKVTRYGYVKEGTPKPKTESYNIQVEVLYIITLLSMSNFAPYYSPYPVLINNKTGKEINDNSKELKKVYKIYRKWFKENKKTGFKNFLPPLYKSNYSWYGSDEKMKDIKVSEFFLPATVIGRSKE